eukprot:5270390-Lingulodinium_polyedra.AAC.1
MISRGRAPGPPGTGPVRRNAGTAGCLIGNVVHQGREESLGERLRLLHEGTPRANSASNGWT